MNATAEVIAVPRFDDLFAKYAQEVHGCPENWQPWFFSCTTDEVPAGFMKLQGAVVHAKRSGKFKGRPNWRKKIDGTTRTLFFLFADFKAWCVQWEQREGICHNCCGEGKTICGSGIKPDGSIYRDYRTCDRCKGSGKPAEQPT